MKISHFGAFLTVLGCTAPGVAASKLPVIGHGASRASYCAPRSVLDFYHLLPAWYFAGDNPSQLLRNGTTKVMAKENFIYVSTHGISPSNQLLHMTVFRHRGVDTVAVRRTLGLGTLRSLTFLRLRNGRLRDVTSQVFPSRLASNVIPNLPLEGTTIMLFRDDYHIGNLLWRGGRFVRQNIRPRRLEPGE